MADKSIFHNVNALLRTVVLGGLVVIAGWWTLFLRGKLADRDALLAAAHEEVSVLASRVEEREGEIRELGVAIEEKDEEILSLAEDVAEKELQIEALDVALDLLKVSQRIGRLKVLRQDPVDADPARVRTTLEFTELGPDGEPIGESRELVVDGKTVYVETLVVKFKDSYVEQGDALRGTSLCLFKGVFGEDQRPSEGVPIDAVGQQPLVYVGDEGPSPLHEEIWRRFWDYANDAALRDQLGIRAIHGEAPFIETRPGKTYWVELRASDGLTIRSE